MIIGRNIDLREVQISDAEFILGLRLDLDLNKYLSKVEDDIEKQREWIKKSKLLKEQEQYFIIQNKKEQPVGTIRIYNIKEDNFCWGSWIVVPAARSYASFESIILLYQYAFLKLGFNYTYFDVRRLNKKALDFYLRFGAIIVDENDQDYFLIFKKDDFIAKQDEYMISLEKITERYQQQA